MKNKIVTLGLFIAVAAFASLSKCRAQAQKRDTVATIPESTYKRIITLQERQKQDQKEIEEALKTSIEFKGFDLANVDWNRTLINIPERRISVSLIKPGQQAITAASSTPKQ